MWDNTSRGRASSFLCHLCARSRACKRLTTAGGHKPVVSSRDHRASPQESPVGYTAAFPQSRMADEHVLVSEDQGGMMRDHRRLVRLYCMNGGHHLQILPDGTVQGQRDDGDAHSKLGCSNALRILHPGQVCQVQSAGHIGGSAFSVWKTVADSLNGDAVDSAWNSQDIPKRGR